MPKKEDFLRFVRIFARLPNACSVFQLENPDSQLTGITNSVNEILNGPDFFSFCDKAVEEVRENLNTIPNNSGRVAFVKGMLRDLYQTATCLNLAGRNRDNFEHVTFRVLSLIDDYNELRNPTTLQKYIFYCDEVFRWFGFELDSLLLDFNIELPELQTELGINFKWVNWQRDLNYLKEERGYDPKLDYSIIAGAMAGLKPPKKVEPAITSFVEKTSVKKTKANPTTLFKNGVDPQPYLALLKKAEPPVIDRMTGIYILGNRRKKAIVAWYNAMRANGGIVSENLTAKTVAHLINSIIPKLNISGRLFSNAEDTNYSKFFLLELTKMNPKQLP